MILKSLRVDHQNRLSGHERDKRPIIKNWNWILTHYQSNKSHSLDGPELLSSVNSKFALKFMIQRERVKQATELKQHIACLLGFKWQSPLRFNQKQSNWTSPARNFVVTNFNCVHVSLFIINRCVEGRYGKWKRRERWQSKVIHVKYCERKTRVNDIWSKISMHFLLSIK